MKEPKGEKSLSSLFATHRARGWVASYKNVNKKIAYNSKEK